MDASLVRQLRNRRTAINVLYTTPPATKAALAAASSLSRDLEIQVRVLAFQVVPYPLDLEESPVSSTIALNRILMELRTVMPDGEFTVRYVLCRDPEEALVRSLSGGSVVVIGGRCGFIASREQRTARKLRNIGHEVVFVPVRGRFDLGTWRRRRRESVFRWLPGYEYGREHSLVRK